MPRSCCFPALCVTILVTACHDPSAPAVVPSSYVARSIEGTSLPATFSHGDVIDVALVADTIHLFPSGVAERISIYRRTRIGAATTVDTSRSQASYTLRGTLLLFHDTCPINANCLGPPAGMFSLDRGQLLLRMWPDGPRALYDRVNP